MDEFRENGEMSIVFISIYGKVEGAKIDRIFAICRHITKEIFDGRNIFLLRFHISFFLFSFFF